MAPEIKILGFNFTKINAERNSNFKGKLEVKSNIHIASIEKEKLQISKTEAVKILFEFTINYGELGKVEIFGSMFLTLDSKSTKELLNGFKSGNVPAEINALIINIILQKASLRALQLEEELSLPLHIQFPRLQPAQNQDSK